MTAKVEDSIIISNQEGVNKSATVSSLFRRIHSLLVLGGIYPGVRSTGISNQRKWSWYKKIYVFTIVAIYTGQASAFCYTIYNRARRGEYLTRVVTFFIIMVTNILISLFSSVTLARELPKLEDAIQRYENQYGLNMNVGTWVKRIKTTTVVQILYMIVFSPVLLFALKNYPKLFCDIYPLCDVQGNWQYFVFAFNVVQTMAVAAQWQGFLIVCLFFAYFLLQQFKNMTHKFKDLTKSTSEPERQFDEYVDHYEIVVDLMKLANNCTCHFSFFGLFITLPVNCSFLYSTLTKPESSGENIFLYFFMASAILLDGIRLLMEASISKQAHRPLQYLWKMRKVIVSNNGSRNLNLFVKRLTSESIGYSIYGLVTINMPTLLAVFGTTAAYIIVVIQFTPKDTSSACHTLIKNITQCGAPCV